ncbi:MAG TPA: diguanylate cyclase, partial [Coleofasciculaceae cyanobacterium]
MTHHLAIEEDSIQPEPNQSKLRHQEHRNTPTNLPNRVFFIKKLQTCIERSHKCQHFLFAVLFLDLDRFKVINDSLGYSSGDKVLMAIANRLKKSVRPNDTVAHLGSDEFAILLENLTDIGHVINLANRLQAELREPIPLDGQDVLTTASIGIAVSMLWYDSPEDILRDADIAMYRAKALGKARSVMFNRTMYRHAVNRLQLETDLRQAILRQELQLYYQPIVSLSTGQLTGFEALVRWQHPKKGLVAPGKFIPVAEETDLIIPIGDWVLREAGIQAKHWQMAFLHSQPLTISVNLSGRQFAQPDLSQRIDQILSETGVERHTLKLEITESSIMEKAGFEISDVQGDGAIATLEQLRELGVQLSIDD